MNQILMINNQIHLCQKLITMLLKIHLLKKTQEEGSSKAEKEVKEKAKKKAKENKGASEKEKTNEKKKNTKEKEIEIKFDWGKNILHM